MNLYSVLFYIHTYKTTKQTRKQKNNHNKYDDLIILSMMFFPHMDESQ